MGSTNFAYQCRRIRHPDRNLNAGSSKVRASLPHETETQEITEIARVRNFDLSCRIWRFLRKRGPGRENQYQCRLQQNRAPSFRYVSSLSAFLRP